MDGTQIGRILTTQGRSRKWLADRTGYSYSYVTAVLTNERPTTPQFLDRVAEALGTARYVVDFRHGLAITIPRSVFEGAVSAEAIAFATEQAWKEAWVHHHGRDVLAAAAERAWAAVTEIEAAGQ